MHLTLLGKEMAELPLDPSFSFYLLLSLEENFNCCDVILSLIAILSVENMFYFNKNEKNNLLKILLKFKIENSDHLTKVNVFHSYMLTKNKKSFCKVIQIQKIIYYFFDKH